MRASACMMMSPLPTSTGQWRFLHRSVCWLQVWLQEFAWTVEEKEEKVLKRAADGVVGEQLANKPMFCFGEVLQQHFTTAS